VPSRPVAVVVAKHAAKSNGSPASNKPASGKPALSKSAPAKPITIVKSSAVRPKAQLMRRPELPTPRPMPIPEAVPTNGKPRKNQAGLTSRELEHFRDLLLEKRRELVGDMYSMESEALRTSGGTNLSNLPLHMADMGTDNYEQEFTLGLVEKDRGLLREINTALAKIQNGTYGICEGTGKPISKPRLEAQPWARHSIESARLLQRPMGMGRVG
jgi:DnaK suppressor protein